MAKPVVAICIPSGDRWHADMGLAAMGLCCKSAAHVGLVPINSKSCYVEDNRNHAVDFALATSPAVDWVLWLDTDMDFPSDSLLRLLAADKRIVGTMYRLRMPPYYFQGDFADGDVSHCLEGGLHRMNWLPGGLILVHASVYRELPRPWYNKGSTREEGRDDVYFCRRATAAGMEIWCDMDLTNEVYHIAEQKIGWQLNPGQVAQQQDAVAQIEAMK